MLEVVNLFISILFIDLFIFLKLLTPTVRKQNWTEKENGKTEH